MVYKMSEQRFYITDTGLGLDTVSDEMYSFGDEEDFCRLFDKLNEQQALIEEQNKLIEKLRWDLNKTREDLNYFANLKVMAMKGCEPNE